MPTLFPGRVNWPRAGARLYLSDEGPAPWKYSFAAADGAILLHDGDSFQVGNVRVDVRHTPGHTPEHLAFLVTDDAHAEEPMGIFTGDFVFVGDVGRPDLLEHAAGIAGTAAPGARQLFRALQRFRGLPEYMQVWPGHGAGSACGKALGAVPQSTVGYETRANWAFQIADEDRFVDAVLAGQPEPPPYFAQMKRINKEGPSPTPAPAPARGTAGDLVRLLAAGWPVIDVRPAAEFAAAYWPGTMNIPAGDAFLQWAGWFLPYDGPFGLIAAEADLAAVRAQLRLIGLDQIACYWTPDIVTQGPQSHFVRVTAADLQAQWEPNSAVVVDTRWADEYATGHIPGSRNIPLAHLRERLGEVPAGRPVIVHCAGGTRSPIAASLLAGQAVGPIVEMRDGFDAWKRLGYPVTR